MANACACARPDRDHRERRRRLRLDRHRPRRARGARRLHAHLGQLGPHVMNGAALTLPYDLMNDFEPVVDGRRQPAADRGRPESAGEQPQGADRLAQGQPGQGLGRTVGAGTPSHVSAAFLPTPPARGFKLVPYRGGGPAMQDLVAGQVDLMIDPGRRSDGAGARRPAQDLRGDAPRRGSRARPTSRPSTRPACPACTSRSGTAVCRAACRRTSSRKVNAAVVETLADPAVRTAARHHASGGPAARTADAARPRRVSEVRDREMVADHQGSRHQGAVAAAARASGLHPRVAAPVLVGHRHSVPADAFVVRSSVRPGGGDVRGSPGTYLIENRRQHHRIGLRSISTGFRRQHSIGRFSSRPQAARVWAMVCLAMPNSRSV